MRFLKTALALAAVLIAVGAEARFPRGTPTAPSRVQKNLVSDYGATCNSQWASRVVTITNSGSGLRDVAVTVNTFAPGDVGKAISITGAAAGNNPNQSTIAAYVDAQHITLSSNADIALSSSTQTISWGTDDTAAFLAFKAAYQGATPVQLNLPGNCSYRSVSGPDQLPFKGIGDLIVAGNGSATSAFVTVGAGNPLFGGSGQYQDNSHSLRTNDANAGDSCVTVKTTPAVTVSAIGNSLPSTATFSASASGTTLTVNPGVVGTIVPGAIIKNQDSNPGQFNTIQAYGTAGTTGVGGAGTYALSTTASFSLQTVTTAPAVFTASVTTTGVMTVSAVQDGSLAVGMWVYSLSGGLSGKTTIKSQINGTPGGAGDYQLDVPPLSTVALNQFQGNGQPRVTLNSTTGLTSGDTLFLTGITGRGQLPQRVNGLRWIKVVNSTQIDIFQSDFDGSYTSGGTGGGDRTSLTPVGSKVMMTGYVLQGYWGAPYGFPSNNHWFEFKTVASTNSGTHQVCFDTPLANAYKAAWPQYSTGNLFEVDPGGPATLYALDPSWELTHVYKDFTQVVPNWQTTANGRSITWDSVKMYGVNCAIPTQNETHNWINVDASTCNIETDKLVGKWNITGGSVRKVHVQSSSMDEINVSGTSLQIWQGSPKKLTLTNSPISCPTCGSADPVFKIGTDSYGVSDETVCTNCSVSAPGIVSRGGDNAPTALWSMSGGVITIPNALSTGSNGTFETQTRYIVPGHYNFWTGSGGGGGTAQVGRAFKVVGVTQDTVNTYVQTSEGGGFPTGTWTTNGLAVAAHPAPKLTITNPTGVDSLTLFGGCTAQAPMFSCANYTRTGGAGGTTLAADATMWGEPTTFTFTNNVPYTNTGSLSWSTPQFAIFPYLTTSNTQTSVNFTINTKLPSSCGSCTRSFTSGGATNTQTGDSFPASIPAGAVFGGALTSVFSANTPSDSPQVTVTLRTNQNLPP